MKQKHKLLPLILSCLALSSCGYGLDSLIQGDTYNSPIFANNYYTLYDKNLSAYIKEQGIDIHPEYTFTTYNEFVQTGLDEQASVLNYFWLPKYQSVSGNYSGVRRMSNIDDTFNNGYLSKLYDGQMFCGGDYQLSRVQVKDSGFSQCFLKEGKGAKYFAMNFKASIDYTNEALLEEIHDVDPDVFPYYPAYYHESSVNLTVDLFVKNNGETHQYTYSQEIKSLLTNSGESGTGAEYKFFGFDLSSLPEDGRIIGYSIHYTFNDPFVTSAKENLGKDLDYSLLVYELMIPFASWN